MKGCAAAFPVIKEGKWAVFCSEQHVGNSNNAFKLWEYLLNTAVSYTSY